MREKLKTTTHTDSALQEMYYMLKRPCFMVKIHGAFDIENGIQKTVIVV
jgi:hypothetical protein